MRIAMALALVLMVVGLTACSGGKSGGVPTEAPSISGTITQQGSSGYLVEEKPGQQAGGAKCWFALTAKTAVYRQDGKLVEVAKPQDLAVGQKVSIWADGPVRESYPCQGDAGTVLILGQ